MLKVNAQGVIEATEELEDFYKATQTASKGSSNLGKETASLDDIFGRMNLSALAGMAGVKVLTDAFGKLTNSIINFSKRAVGAFAQFEGLQKSLNVTIGDGVKAMTEFQALKEYANATPYTVTGLASVASQLHAVGIGSTEAMEMLKRFGDVALGDSEKMSRITQNYAQIVSVGKSSAIDTKQFAMMGIPIYDMLKRIGVTGQATAEQIKLAFTMMTDEGGKFYKGMEAGADTLNVAFNQLNGATQSLMASFGGLIADDVKGTLSLVTSLVTKLDNAISKLNNHPLIKALLLGTLVGGITALAGTIISLLIPALTAIIGKLMVIAGLTSIINPTSLIIGGIVGGVTALAVGIKGIRDENEKLKESTSSVTEGMIEESNVIKEYLQKVSELAPEKQILKYNKIVEEKKGWEEEYNLLLKNREKTFSSLNKDTREFFTNQDDINNLIAKGMITQDKYTGKLSLTKNTAKLRDYKPTFVNDPSREASDEAKLLQIAINDFNSLNSVSPFKLSNLENAIARNKGMKDEISERWSTEASKAFEEVNIKIQEMYDKLPVNKTEQLKKNLEEVIALRSELENKKVLKGVSEDGTEIWETFSKEGFDKIDAVIKYLKEQVKKSGETISLTWQEVFNKVTGVDPTKFNNNGSQSASEFIKRMNYMSDINANKQRDMWRAFGIAPTAMQSAEFERASIESEIKTLVDTISGLYAQNPNLAEGDKFSEEDGSISDFRKELNELTAELKKKNEELKGLSLANAYKQGGVIGWASELAKQGKEKYSDPNATGEEKWQGIGMEAGGVAISNSLNTITSTLQNKIKTDTVQGKAVSSGIGAIQNILNGQNPVVAVLGAIANFLVGWLMDDLFDEQEQSQSEREILQQIKGQLETLNKNIDDQLDYLNEVQLRMQQNFLKAQVESGSLVSERSVNDMILSPHGNFSTAPDDYIMAMKHPEDLMGGKSYTVVNVNVENNASDTVQAEVTENKREDGTTDLMVTISKKIAGDVATGTNGWDSALMLREQRIRGRSL